MLSWGYIQLWCRSAPNISPQPVFMPDPSHCVNYPCTYPPSIRSFPHLLDFSLQKSTPSHMKEITFTCSLVINWIHLVYGLLGFNASATTRVTRRWNDDDEISFLVEETGEPGGNHRPMAIRLLVVSECLKDRAIHIRTVYVNSLDPNGIVWRLGKPQFRKVSRVSWFVYKGLCGPHKLWETFMFSPLSAHCLAPYFHRM